MLNWNTLKNLLNNAVVFILHTKLQFWFWIISATFVYVLHNIIFESYTFNMQVLFYMLLEVLSAVL